MQDRRRASKLESPANNKTNELISQMSFEESSGLKKRKENSGRIEPPTSSTFQSQYSGLDNQFSFNGYSTPVPAFNTTETEKPEVVTFNSSKSSKKEAGNALSVKFMYEKFKDMFMYYWEDPESKDQLITFSLYAAIILCCVFCVIQIIVMILLGVGGTFLWRQIKLHGPEIAKLNFITNDPAEVIENVVQVARLILPYGARIPAYRPNL